MKKIICAILSICLLLSYMAVPIGVVAAENGDDYEATTLGGYYKFTFSQNDIYNYTVGAKVTYKNGQWYVKGGKLVKETTLVSYKGEWWYIKIIPL